jgi:hypothetical protein
MVALIVAGLVCMTIVLVLTVMVSRVVRFEALPKMGGLLRLQMSV